jgi:uncharacterized membrane protein
VGRRFNLGQVWRSLVIILLLLGIWFRVANLDRKVYWVDEVATAIRVAGYTKSEITQRIIDRTVAPAELLQYQTITPDRTWQDSFHALKQSPEHAPLYFVLVRAWALVFGSSAVAMRSLSVIFSLIALPCWYGLAIELFQSRLAASIALSLAAVSPFFVAYAQESRPYSLWTLTILLSSWLLLKATASDRRIYWVGYALAATLGLYTTLLSLWVMAGQGVYAIGQKRTGNFTIAALWSVLAFSPWLWVIMQHWQKLQDNTVWMRAPMNFLAMWAVWLYSVVITFVDFPVYLPVDGVILFAIVADIGLLTLVGIALYSLKGRSRFLLYTLLVSTPLCLVVLDLITGGQSSTAPRYFIPLQISVQLAIAFWFSKKFKTRRWLWAIVISMGVISGVVNLENSPKYQKVRNLHNGAIAALINQAESPLVITEDSNTTDMLSLSRDLRQNVEIRVLSQQSGWTIPQTCRPIFVFNPSEQWRDRVQLQPVYQPRLLIPDEISLTLWAVKRSNCSALNREYSISRFHSPSIPPRRSPAILP